MLTIRSEQHERLQAYALDQYVERTLEQFQQYFPGPSHVTGDDALRNMIRLGVDRAASHRFVGECNVVLYTSLMLLCGSFFDEDPQYRWARQVLDSNSLTDEAERAERLYDAGVEYWDRVAGENRTSLIRTAMRARKESVEQFEGASPHQIADRLREAWPQKAAVLGEEGLRDVLAEGRLVAERYAMLSRRDQAVVSGLVFTLGSGFDKDPMQPWASKVLMSAEIPDEDRGARLYRESQQYAERWTEFAKQEAD